MSILREKLLNMLKHAETISLNNLTLVTHITHTRTYTNAALYILGTEYCKAGASVNKGLSDLLERVGQQSGLFGPSPTPTSTPSAPSASHPSAGDHFLQSLSPSLPPSPLSPFPSFPLYFLNFSYRMLL